MNDTKNQQLRGFSRYLGARLGVQCRDCGQCRCWHCDPEVDADYGADSDFDNTEPSRACRGVDEHGHQGAPRPLDECCCETCVAAALYEASREAPQMCAFARCPNETVNGGFFCTPCWRQVSGRCVARECRRRAQDTDAFAPAGYCDEHAEHAGVRCLASGCRYAPDDLAVEDSTGMPSEIRGVHVRRFLGYPERPCSGGPHLHCSSDSPLRESHRSVAVEASWTADYCRDHKHLAGRVGVYCHTCRTLRPRSRFRRTLPADGYSAPSCAECEPRVIAYTLYRMFDRTGTLLYIGKSIDLVRRFDNHRRDKAWQRDLSAERGHRPLGRW
jgi:hypothetical protein